MGTKENKENYGVSPGDLVRFIKEQWPRKNLHDTGILEWKVGILVNIKHGNAFVLSDGTVEIIDANEMQKIQ